MMRLFLAPLFLGLMNNNFIIITVMMIAIGTPCAITEKGGRLNNEDSIFPPAEAVNTNQRLFIVCDGVGGSEKGEIASALACESIQVFFNSFLENEDPSPGFIQKAILYTEAQFDEYVKAHPSAKGMATTLTLMYIGKSGITLAHVGDSRIYQFRKGRILYRTEDHSLVNSLYKFGKISEEEMYNHPQKNVIIRAIQGSERPTEANVVLLNNIINNDYFFMCTDGVLERFSDAELSVLFSGQYSADQIKDIIMEECNSKTKDNFSFYIVPLNQVLQHMTIKQNILSFLYSFI